MSSETQSCSRYSLLRLGPHFLPSLRFIILDHVLHQAIRSLYHDLVMLSPRLTQVKLDVQKSRNGFFSCRRCKTIIPRVSRSSSEILDFRLINLNIRFVGSLSSDQTREDRLFSYICLLFLSQINFFPYVLAIGARP